MVELTRTVRFFLNSKTTGNRPKIHNGFAGWPPPRGLGRFLQIHVCCRGDVDRVTGYFMNIRRIDEAVRTHAIDCLQRMLDQSSNDAQVPMGRLLTELIEAVRQPLNDTVHSLQLDLSAYHSLSIWSQDMQHALIKQQFEFCAAHRLHAANLTDEQNRQVFGKCNNPSGHGHNYRLEVAAKAPIRADGSVVPVEQLEALVDETVIEYLDHKHLNVDVAEFADCNPSVENIAKVIYERLDRHMARLDVELDAVSVWETPKTMCTYRGSHAESHTNALPQT